MKKIFGYRHQLNTWHKIKILEYRYSYFHSKNLFNLKEINQIVIVWFIFFKNSGKIKIQVEINLNKIKLIKINLKKILNQ